MIGRLDGAGIGALLGLVFVCCVLLLAALGSLFLEELTKPAAVALMLCSGLVMGAICGAAFWRKDEG